MHRWGYRAANRSRAALLAVVALAACARPEAVPTPPAPTWLVVVETRGEYTVHAYDAAARAVRPLVRRPPDSRLWVLGYDEPLDQLQLVIGKDGRVTLDAEGLPLPPPRSWTMAAPDDEPDAGPDDRANAQARLAGLLESVRVARTCRTLVPRTRALGTGVGRQITLAAVLAEDTVFVGVAFLDEDVVVDGKPEKRWKSPGYFAHVTPQAITPQTGVSVGRTPIGFGEQDGTVWATFSSSSGLDRYLCHFPRGVVAPEHCERMAFEGEPPPWAPYAMAGHRSSERGMELVAMNYDQGLYYWRESQRVWRLLRKDGAQGPNDPCRVGIQTLALTMDGPGTGLASFPRGPLLRFRVPLADGPAELVPDFPDLELCRTTYRRLADGTEALAVTRLPSSDFDSATTLWLRNAPTEAWQETPPKVPEAFVLKTRALGEVWGDLVLSYTPRGVGTLDLAAPLRLGLPPTSCPVTAVGSEGQILLFTGKALFVTGIHDKEAGGTNNIDWLWPCSTADPSCRPR